MYNGRTFVYTIEDECGETVKVFTECHSFLHNFHCRLITPFMEIVMARETLTSGPRDLIHNVTGRLYQAAMWRRHAMDWDLPEWHSRRRWLSMYSKSQGMNASAARGLIAASRSG